MKNKYLLLILSICVLAISQQLYAEEYKITFNKGSGVSPFVPIPYDQWGFYENGTHKITGTDRDQSGYDVNGYDQDGCGSNGYDINGISCVPEIVGDTNSIAYS